MNFEQTEITKDMTELEQFTTYFKNWLVRDQINEYYKEEDEEEYLEYITEFKAPFNEFGDIEQVKTIFFKVDTDNGDKYFVINSSFYEGFCSFEEVTLKEVNAIV